MPPSTPPDPTGPATAGQWTGDESAALLRAAGRRPTPQRLLVLEALGHGAHVSADDVLAYARERFPSISAATIYRALDALVEAGIAQRSDLQAGRWHFELAHRHRHHHVVCQRCGAVAHLHDSGLAAFAEGLAEQTGFTLSTERELTIPALCPDCRSRGTR